VVPRRRLKQFAINFPRTEGNGAGNAESGVAEPGHRKDSEQGFCKESIRGKPISFSVVAVPPRLSEMLRCIAFVISFNILKASSRMPHDNTHFIAVSRGEYIQENSPRFCSRKVAGNSTEQRQSREANYRRKKQVTGNNEQ